MPQNLIFWMNSSWITAVSITGFIVFLWLALISGRGYSVEDTEAHASNYGDIIKEGHGGMTAFLWGSFILLFLWVIYYFIIHGYEFDVIFSGF